MISYHKEQNIENQAKIEWTNYRTDYWSQLSGFADRSNFDMEWTSAKNIKQDIKIYRSQNSE